jgi:hypothetical protein
MARRDCVIAVYERYSDASQAVRQLEVAGLGANVSIVGRKNEVGLEDAGPLDQGDEMEKSAALGAATGATLGLLASSALLVVPGIGPVLFAGAIASGLTGGIVGGLVGAMSGWGVKEDRAKEYEDDLLAGRTLVIADGDPVSLAEIQGFLQRTPAVNVTIHAESADVRVDA